MIPKYYSLKIEAEKISKMKDDEKTLLKAAHLIREEECEIEDEISWPSQANDLDEEKGKTRSPLITITRQVTELVQRPSKCSC